MRKSRHGPIFDIGESINCLRNGRIQRHVSLGLTGYSAPFKVTDKMIVGNVPAVSIMDRNDRIVEDENEIPRIFFTRDFELHEE